MQALKELIRRFPLPAPWCVAEPFIERLQIAQLTLHLIGLTAEGKKGSVVASAVSTEEFPWGRAYFELLERVAIVESSLGDAEDPQRTQGFWSFSRSNGVAAHTELELAKASARYELIERNQILRSWFGQITPQLFSSSPAGDLHSLSQYYEFESYDFGASVVGIFGFPRTREYPLVQGYGARECLESSVRHATAELLQRLGFLWGESVPDRIPEFSPSADFHLEYFLTQEGENRLRRWLSGEHAGLFNVYQLNDECEAPFFEDLTPQSLKASLYVVRAHSNHLMPLTFGMGNPFLDPIEKIPEELRPLLVHPIA